MQGPDRVHLGEDAIVRRCLYNMAVIYYHGPTDSFVVKHTFWPINEDFSQ